MIINTKTNSYINLTSANCLTVAAGNHKVIGDGDGSSGSTSDIGFPASSTNNISSGASFEIQGRIRGGGSDFTKIGGGTLILAGHNGNTGGWQAPLVKIEEGILRLAVTGAAGHSGNDFIVSSGAAIEVSDSSSQGVSTGDWTLYGIGIGGNGALRSISGNNTLNSSGAGGIILASPSSIGVDSGSTCTVNRVISGANALSKVGGGTLILTSTNRYTGTTTVSGGKLLVKNVSGSGTGTGAVNVDSGGTLGGTGAVSGVVTLLGTGGIDLRDSAVETLELGSDLAINGAAGENNLYFDLGNGAGGTDKITVNGNVSMTTPNAAVITLNQLSGAAIAAGTYDLIVATGTMETAGKFTLATTAGEGMNFRLQLDGTAKKLQLVVSLNGTMFLVQ